MHINVSIIGHEILIKLGTFVIEYQIIQSSDEQEDTYNTNKDPAKNLRQQSERVTVVLKDLL